MIILRDISFKYQELEVLKKISLEFDLGEFCFILGQNGAGKSTLLKSINGILPCQKGEIEIFSKNIESWDLKDLAKEIAFIPQEFHMQFDFTVRDFLLMGRYPWLSFLGNYNEHDHDMVDKYLKILDLVPFADKYYNQLSGGEKQRVLICRSLVQETKYILMDESLSHLDIAHQIDILEMLSEIHIKEKKSIIMIVHNLNLASEFADRIIFLKNGQVLDDGSAYETFTKKNIDTAFEINSFLITNPNTSKQNIVYSNS